MSIPAKQLEIDMNFRETQFKVNTIMGELSARHLWSAKATVGSYVDAYRVGDQVVIVHTYKDGGCSHYVQGHGNTWEAMETQLHQIAAEAV